MEKKLRVLWIALLLAMLLSACTMLPEEQSLQTLGDLVFTEGAEEYRYTILLPESGELVPYLVLTKDYGGNCLLLRKYLLDETFAFNPNVRDGAYYEDSAVDRFLNTEFWDSLPETLRKAVPDSNVVITSRESLSAGEEAVMEIQRKIFLLSAAEVCGLGFRTTADEGELLDYFNSGERRIATNADGMASSWWLRTPNLWYDNVVCGVDSIGAVGNGGVGSYGDEPYQNGVRPAFCLRPDMKICQVGEYYQLSVLMEAGS